MPTSRIRRFLNGYPKHKRRKSRLPLLAIPSIGAGLVFLVGGGTWLVWRDSSSGAQDHTIVGGSLTVDAGEAVIQEITNEKELITIPTLDGFVVVPGELFRITQELDITLHGEHLVAELGLDFGTSELHAHDGWEVISENLNCQLHDHSAAPPTKDGVGLYEFAGDYLGDEPTEETCYAVFDVAFLTDEHHPHLYQPETNHHGTQFQGETISVAAVTATLTQVSH